MYSKQPVWNLKCIVLTLSLALGYWFLPPRNKWVLLGILFLTYLALAWYDYLYACQRNMGPTYLSLFYIWFKPAASQQIQDFHNWDPAIKRHVLMVDSILLVAVLLMIPAFLRWKPKRVC